MGGRGALTVREHYVSLFFLLVPLLAFVLTRFIKGWHQLLRLARRVIAPREHPYVAARYRSDNTPAR